MNDVITRQFSTRTNSPFTGYATKEEAVFTISYRRDRLTAWVSELESGRYPQTKGVLRNGEGFCCLGVACEMAVAEKVIPPVLLWPTDSVEYAYAADAEAVEDVRATGEPGAKVHYGNLPAPVFEWLGGKVELISAPSWYEPEVMLHPLYRNTIVVDVDPHGVPISGATANDSLNWDFGTIAAHVRRFWLDEPA